MTAKVIIVTGASRGIGFAVAQDLLAASHKVLLVSRSEKELAELKEKYPSQVQYMTADLTSLKVTPKVIECAVRSFGRLDGIVINHGALLPMQRIAESSITDWKHIYDANLFSALALAKESIPHLRKTKGRMIFTSSGAAGHAYASWGAYGSSKAALNSLAAHIAIEEPDIVTVSLAPGRVNTTMQQQLREHGKAVMSEADHTRFVSDFDQGRLVDAELPAQVIARLSLEAGNDLTGRFLSWNSAELEQYRNAA